MKKMLLAFSLLPILLFSSCYDYKDFNNTATIAGLALDIEGENFVLTAEALRPSGDKMTTYILRGEGETIEEAFAKLTEAASERVYVGYCRAFIISEAAAKNGVNDIVEFILSNRDFRLTMDILLASSNKASHIFTESDTDEIISYSLSDGVENLQKISSSSVSLEVYEAKRMIGEAGVDIAVPVVHFREDLPIIEGCVCFSGNNPSKYLNGEQTLLLNILNGKVKKAYLNVITEKGLAPFIIENGKSDINVSKDGTAEINVFLEGKISENKSEAYSDEEMKN